MTRPIHRRRGFTLLEMMVAVAIIGILASTSVALFRNYQLRSRMAEAKSNLASIRSAQQAYFAERSAYVTSVSCPGLGPLGPTKQNWRAVRGTFCDPSAPTTTTLDTLGWAPDGATLFDYDAMAEDVGDGPRFTVAAFGDADGDGNISVVAYTHPDNAGNISDCWVCGSWPGANPKPSLPPWNPVTCDVLTKQVAQVPNDVSCGFTPADNF